jgi:hypothetical protein
MPSKTQSQQSSAAGASQPNPPLPVMSNLALSNRRGVLTVNFPCSASGSASARIRVGSQVWRSAPKAYACKSLRGAPTFRLPATLTKTLRHHRAAASASLIVTAAHKTRTLSLTLNGARAGQINKNLDTAHFWATGNADCNDFVYYDTPYIEVTPPAVNEYQPPEGGSMWFYWRSGLITWDGIHNKWLPNRAGDNGSGGNWNWAQYSSFELDADVLVTSSGHQYYTMPSGQNLYTYAWVQTYYWINGAWYGGRSKWMQNHGYHPLVGGYCYWA